MKSHCQTDAPRVHLYMNENKDWQSTLVARQHEVLQMEKMLVQAVLVEDLPAEDETGTDLHFYQQLMEHQQSFEQLNNELQVQQERLANDSKNKSTYDTEALCTQDILRERIRDIEKRYAELKCNFMQYLSGIL